ncbi:MAG: helix-turn-helix domain-containing protein [Thermoleophilia bacterium]
MSRKQDITLRFGERLRDLREARELSQEAFAYKAGLDRTYISGIERGKRNLAIRNIEKIAQALDISISELMKGV